MIISLIINVLALLVTLGILVTFHEFGHFWVARRCGVRVERFSIGFGKPLLRWQRGDTEYVIAALPLGGYVKMLGEQDNEVPGEQAHMAFNNKSLAQRSAIVAAGPLANFILAFFLYWVMFLSGVSGLAPVVGKVDEGSAAAQAGLQAGDEIIAVDGRSTATMNEARMAMAARLGETGLLDLTVRAEASSQSRNLQIQLQQWLINETEPDILGSLGISPFRLDIPARIGQLLPGERAQEAGLQPGDLVTAVNGEALDGWTHWVEIISANPENDLLVTVEREGTAEVLTVRPAQRVADDGSLSGYIGAGVEMPEVMPELPAEMTREIRYNPLTAVPRALSETWQYTVFVLDSFKKIVTGLISVKNLSGPISIAQYAGESATYAISYGLEYFLSFLAILSISLGVLNLLPIPVLDGGHLFYYLVEFVTRKPVSDRVREIGMQLGILLIVGITFIAIYNDVNRLL
ncbi:MAG: RIP metalloprotease RseP [Pseudohongiellaceae bacterium]